MSEGEDHETEAVRFLRNRVPSLLRRKGGGYDISLGDVGEYMKGVSLREEFIRLYGFAILDRDTIDALVDFAPLLEVGAGSGYWTYELRKAGVDVIATDVEPGEDNRYKFAQAWTAVQKLDAVAAAKRYRRRTLLTVWPDYREQWSADALKAYKGKRVIYVGEGDGGCTACDEFHEHLYEHFESVYEAALYQFSGIHDRLEVWERKDDGSSGKDVSLREAAAL